MLVILVKNCSHGKAGDSISGPSAWRLAFPCKGCVGRPADAEALAAVEGDISGVSGSTKVRLLSEMSTAGTYPVVLASPAKEPEPAPEVVVAEVTEVEVEKTEPKVVEQPKHHKQRGK